MNSISIWVQTLQTKTSLLLTVTLYDHLQMLSTNVMLICYISGIRFVQPSEFCHKYLGSCFFFYLLHFTKIFFCGQYQKAPEGSARKIESRKQFAEAMAHRMHVDSSIKLLGKVLFGIEKGPEVLSEVRPAGQPLVDDWDCLKTFVSLTIKSLTYVLNQLTKMPLHRKEQRKIADQNQCHIYLVMITYG